MELNYDSSYVISQLDKRENFLDGVKHMHNRISLYPIIYNPIPHN